MAHLFDAPSDARNEVETDILKFGTVLDKPRNVLGRLRLQPSATANDVRDGFRFNFGDSVGNVRPIWPIAFLVRTKVA